MRTRVPDYYGAFRCLAGACPHSCCAGWEVVIDQDTAPRATLRPEVHRKYVDVQFLAAGGPERIGWYEDLGDNEVDEELLETRDIIFYKNNPAAAEGVIEMRPGTYAAFFPWDVHIPAIETEGGSAPIRKIVIKVAVDTL